MQNILWLMSMAAAAVVGTDDALKPWSANTQPTDAAKVARRGDHGGATQVHGDSIRHDGRAELPLTHGVRDCAGRGHAADLGVQPLGADGKRRRERMSSIRGSPTVATTSATWRRSFPQP